MQQIHQLESAEPSPLSKFEKQIFDCVMSEIGTQVRITI